MCSLTIERLTFDVYTYQLLRGREKYASLFLIPCHHGPLNANSFDLGYLGAIMIFGVAEVVNHFNIVLEHDIHFWLIYIYIYIQISDDLYSFSYYYFVIDI